MIKRFLIRGFIYIAGALTLEWLGYSTDVVYLVAYCLGGITWNLFYENKTAS